MLDEARRLHVVGVRKDEFLILSGRRLFFIKIMRAQGAVDQRHRHGLALALAKAQAVAPGELWRHAARTLELVDHLAFGEFDDADFDLEAELLGRKAHPNFAIADLACERMAATVAALGRIAECQKKALI